MSRPKAKRRTATEDRACRPVAIGPVTSVAAEIETIQRQRDKNNRRINVIANEMSTLSNENSTLERRRLELLREFDTVAR